MGAPAGGPPPDASKRKLGLIIAWVGMLGSTPDAMLLRFQAQAGGGPASISFFRFIMTATLNFVFAAANSGGIGPLCAGVARSYKAILVAAMIAMVSSQGFVYSLLLVEPAMALLIISLNPVWAALLGKFVLGEELPGKTIITIVCALVSMVVVMIPQLLVMLGYGGEAEEAAADTKGSNLLLLWPLFTGMFMALFITWARYLGKVSPETDLTATGTLSGAITSCISYKVAYDQGITDPFEGIQPIFWLWVLLCGLGITMYNLALVIAPRYISGADTALIMLLETVFAPVWVFFAFGEVPSPWTILGGVILLGALAFHELAGTEAGSGEEGAPLAPRITGRQSIAISVGSGPKKGSGFDSDDYVRMSGKAGYP